MRLLQASSESSDTPQQLRREKLYGKCFPCGKADHVLPECTRPAHLSCGKCGKKGHAKLACSRATANNTAPKTQRESQEQLTSELDKLSLSEQPANIYSSDSAHAMNSQANTPTPTVWGGGVCLAVHLSLIHI